MQATHKFDVSRDRNKFSENFQKKLVYRGQDNRCRTAAEDANLFHAIAAFQLCPLDSIKLILSSQDTDHKLWKQSEWCDILHFLTVSAGDR